jgi:hypothetical protein
LVKTLKISDNLHIELTKVKGELTAATGKEATYENTITELIKFWKKQR